MQKPLGELIYPHQSGQNEAIGCLLISSGSFRSPKQILLEIFFLKLKNSRSTSDTIIGAHFYYRKGRDEVISRISNSNCSVEYQEQLCRISGR